MNVTAIVKKPATFSDYHVADLGLGSVGHHHDTIGKEDRLIDIVRDHERGDAIAPP